MRITDVYRFICEDGYIYEHEFYGWPKEYLMDFAKVHKDDGRVWSLYTYHGLDGWRLVRAFYKGTWHLLDEQIGFLPIQGLTKKELFERL